MSRPFPSLARDLGNEMCGKSVNTVHHGVYAIYFHIQQIYIYIYYLCYVMYIYIYMSICMLMQLSFMNIYSCHIFKICICVLKNAAMYHVHICCKIFVGHWYGVCCFLNPSNGFVGCPWPTASGCSRPAKATHVTAAAAFGKVPLASCQARDFRWFPWKFSRDYKKFPFFGDQTIQIYGKFGVILTAYCLGS